MREGDYAAYSLIYELYWSVLLQHAIRMLRDEDEAKDVVQDVFTMLWAKRDELYLSGPLSAFLYASLRNKILNQIDRSKVRAKYISSLGSFIEAGGYAADEKVMVHELAKIIEEGIAALPPKMREVFELSRVHHLSHQEISEHLNISGNTVKKQINNAIKLLRLKVGIPILGILLLLR